MTKGVSAPGASEVASPDLISVPEAAKRVGIHPDTLYRLCRVGQFPPAVSIGRRWRVSVPRLEHYLHGDHFLTVGHVRDEPSPVRA